MCDGKSVRPVVIWWVSVAFLYHQNKPCSRQFQYATKVQSLHVSVNKTNIYWRHINGCVPQHLQILQVFKNHNFFSINVFQYTIALFELVQSWSHIWSSTKWVSQMTEKHWLNGGTTLNSRLHFWCSWCTVVIAHHIPLQPRCLYAMAHLIGNFVPFTFSGFFLRLGNA